MAEIDILLRKALPWNIQTTYPSSLPPGIKPSAVLIALQKEEEGWKMLFTRRSEQLAEHGGQIAFPGGQAEAGDSGPLQTALREAREEVGLPPEDADPLGILEPADTSTGFRIWPVVCLLRRKPTLHPAPPEVMEIFWIPLAWLREKKRWEWKPVPSEGGRSTHRAVFFEPYQGRVLWGATAWITSRLLETLRAGQTT
jgi:8-oxo-dGTP pyrophosphatase MutT (NUDIX family)